MTQTIKQKLRQKLKSVRPLLLAQILFTVFAFALMCTFGYFFMRNVVHEHLIVSTENMLDYEQSQIEAELTAPKTAAGIFSETIKRMIQNGADESELQAYIDEISDYLQPDRRHPSSFGSILCYFDKLNGRSAFLSDLKSGIPVGFQPTEQAWYRNAVDANGSLAETVIDNDALFGGNILTYSYCLLDQLGRRLGVVCFVVRVDVIGNSVVRTTSDAGGYGVLLSQDLTVLAYPEQTFVGKGMKYPALNMSSFADELVKDKVITERAMTSSQGKSSIAFFRGLDNGWYLGAVIPSDEYYKSMTNMAWILAILGVIFAAALIIIQVRIDRARNRADLESKQKSAFLANMSHEIRTPLNAIIGMTNIGEASDSAEHKDYCFSKIEDASHHLLGVINDILDMSKIEADMFSLSEVEYNFETTLQRVVNVVNFRIDEKHQKLTVNIDRHIPRMLIGDDQRLMQVITNLLGNAVKFTPDYGSVTLSASLLGEKNGVCEIKIEVTDTGIGISQPQQEKLFQAFQQAESSTARKFGGTGLGLAISKKITELMGGRIWVESELGQGSTFSFTTFAKRGEEREERISDNRIHWGSVRIMVVDDDPDILTYFRTVMREFGAGCDTAASGAEALEMIGQNDLHNIYFVDWKMPDMDGIELTRELKARAAPADNPVVIMISAADWNTVEKQAKKAGVDEFLSKPLFPSGIANVVNKILGVKRLGPEEKENIDGIFKGRRIILAEDVDINREIVAELLEPTLIGIDCAKNGLEAVRLFSQAPELYDVILMDVQMPEMDGYDATRSIRSLTVPKAASVPIIALTANVFREDIEQCLKAGMDDHLGKPIDLDELIAKLREYMK